MLEITLPVENPQIKINKTIFDLQMSDVDIISGANELLKKYTKYNERPASDFGIDEIISDCESANAFLDGMLGEGATKKLSRGKPVRLQLLIKWITIVVEAVSASYAEAVMGA